MKFCPKCGAENKDVAAFCVKCGSPIPVATPSETQTIPPVVTPIQQTPAPVQPTPVAPRAAKTRRSRPTFARIAELGRSTVLFALSVVMFILSFFGATSVNGSDFADSSDQSGEILSASLIQLDISAPDVIEGAFARIDPKTSDEVIADFTAFMAESLDEYDLNLLRMLISSGSAYDEIQASKMVADLIEDYNILKFAAMREMTDVSPSGTMELWIGAALALLYIGVSCAFMVYAGIDFILTLLGRKKKSSKAGYTFAAMTLGTAIVFSFFLRATFGTGMAGAMIAFLILAVCSLAVEFAFRLSIRESTLTFAKLPQYISSAVGVVLSAFVLFLVCGSTVDLVCRYTNASGGNILNIFRDGYSSADLVGAWDALRLVEDTADPNQIYGHAAEYIASLFSYTSSSGTLSEGLSPAVMGIYGLDSIETVLAVFGILGYVFTVGFVVVLGLSVADRIRAFFGERNAKTVYTVLIPIFACLTLASAIVCVVLVNSTMDGVKNVDYSLSVSGGLIAGIVLAVVETVQRIVFRVLGKEPKASFSENAAPAYAAPSYAAPAYVGGTAYPPAAPVNGIPYTPPVAPTSPAYAAPTASEKYEAAPTASENKADDPDEKEQQ